MHLVDSLNSTFTQQELDRLAAYRAAVMAGFYTDWDGTAEAPDTESLAWLAADGGLAETAAYPFTLEERQRLEGCRTAVANGRYTDELPPIDTGATPGEQTR